MTKPATPGKLVKHSTIYAIGTISRQLVSFLMLPVYTHYMTPADYGVVGLLTFTLALMEPFFGARLGDAIPKFYLETDDSVRRRAVLSVALTITGLISGIASLIIFLCRTPASNLLFGTDQFGLVVGLFGFQIVTQALEYYGFTFIRLQQKPILFIVVSLAKLIVQLGMNIWLIAFLRMGVMGVVISGGLSSAIFATALSSYILKSNGYRFDFDLSKRMLAFSWPLWFSGLAGLYIWQSNRYLIRFFGSLDQVGLYELALKFASILTFLVWSPFTQVWDVERFNYHKDQNAKQIFSNVFRIMSVFLVVIALGISIFATPTIQLMSAPSFHGATASVPFLVLASIFSCLVNYANFSFLISGQTKRITFNNYVTMGGITVFNLVLIPPYGEKGAAIAIMLAMGGQFFLVWHASKTIYDMNIRLNSLFTTLAIAIAGFLVSQLASQTGEFWLNVGIQVVIYIFTTVALSVNLWRDPEAHAYLSKVPIPFLNRLPSAKSS